MYDYYLKIFLFFGLICPVIIALLYSIYSKFDRRPDRIEELEKRISNLENQIKHLKSN